MDFMKYNNIKIGILIIVCFCILLPSITIGTTSRPLEINYPSVGIWSLPQNPSIAEYVVYVFPVHSRRCHDADDYLRTGY